MMTLKRRLSTWTSRVAACETSLKHWFMVSKSELKGKLWYQAMQMQVSMCMALLAIWPGQESSTQVQLPLQGRSTRKSSPKSSAREVTYQTSTGRAKYAETTTCRLYWTIEYLKRQTCCRECSTCQWRLRLTTITTRLRSSRILLVVSLLAT